MARRLSTARGSKVLRPSTRLSHAQPKPAFQPGRMTHGNSTDPFPACQLDHGNPETPSCHPGSTSADRRLPSTSAESTGQTRKPPISLDIVIRGPAGSHPVRRNERCGGQDRRFLPKTAVFHSGTTLTPPQQAESTFGHVFFGGIDYHAPSLLSGLEAR